MRPETFTREDKLLKTADFRRVYSNHASFKRESFWLSVAPNNLDRARLGISISARAVRLATRRNRLKRLVREVFRKNLPRLKKGLDIVVGVKRDPGAGIGYKKVEELLLGLAGRAAII